MPVVTMPVAARSGIARALEIGMVVYLTIYAFEGAVRYGLFKIGLDNAIVLRDAALALLLLPTFFMFGIGSYARVYLAWFVAIIGLHGLIIFLNFGDPDVVGYTAKEFMPILFGAILGRATGAPSRFVVNAFMILWAITVVGLVLDKFVLSFPWTGISTVVGGFKVEVGKDWFAHGFDKRVGGFTRSSIHAALVLPLLSMMMLVSFRNWLVRFLIVAVTSAAILLTTQKGSLIGYVLIGVCFVGSFGAIRGALKSVLVLGLLLTFSLPGLLSGVTLPGGGGNFSLSSFALRTSTVWPDAFDWIARHQVFPFGVGIGGIGAAQRLYAPGQLNPADNMFLFLYASFGVMGFAYVAYVSYLCLSQGKRKAQFDLFPRAVVAFHFTYGAVMSIVEDQSSCIILGLSIGYLLFARSPEPAEEVVAVSGGGARATARAARPALTDPPLSVA